MSTQTPGWMFWRRPTAFAAVLPCAGRSARCSDELAHADAAARDRQMPRLARLMAVERIRALTLSDEIRHRQQEMRVIGLDPDKLDAESA